MGGNNLCMGTFIIIMNRILTLLFATCLICFLPSCHKDKNDEPEQTKTKRTVLIYAVASNDLWDELILDIEEMIQAAPDVKGLESEARVFLYSVPKETAAMAILSELKKDATGNWEFSEVKLYDRDMFSTDPERMREVFDDVADISPSERYGLILWSHGTGWIPNFSDHEVPSASGIQKSFGIDKYQGATDHCDINELADAIPDRMFDYIWFDLCYMMGVEVVYQLRNKCEYIAGYPTEDWSTGMNYETTLPMLAAYDADLAGVGKAFFDYYNSRNWAVTVTVMSTAQMEKLAKAASDIYAAGKRPDTAYGLMNYSRLKFGQQGLYDFGQYTKKYLDLSGSSFNNLKEELDRVIAEMTLFAACSTVNFNKEEAFDPEQYSGLSCHFPGTGSAREEDYYFSLDWAKAVNP